MVWESVSEGLFGRRYSLSGAPLADAFVIVDDSNVQASHDPSVAYWPPGGGVLAVWSDRDPLDADPDDFAIKIRYFDEAGVGAPPFVVNTHTAGAQDQPAISVGADANLFTVWRSTSSPGDNDGTSIRARPYNRNGFPLPSLRVNGYTMGDQSAPDAAVSPDGKAFVVWQGPSAGSDVNTNIRGRLFDDVGTPLTDDRQINEPTSEAQETPKVAAFEDGSFFVVWNAPSGVRGRMISADGSVMGAELVLNESPDRSIRDVDLSIASGGRFVVSWVADSPSYPDAYTAQFARRFVRPVFADTFEAGDLSAWDVMVP